MTPTIVPTATQTIAETFPYSADWHYENQSGYSYDLTIKLGRPTRIPMNGTLTHPLDQDLVLGSACSVDPQLDIVIPATWSATATTTGYDTPIYLRANFGGVPWRAYSGAGVAPFRDDSRLQVEQNFGSFGEITPDCASLSSVGSFNDSFNVHWPDPIPKGSTRTQEFFIIVKDYYLPATPRGDVALLDSIVLEPINAGDFDVSAMVYSAVGSWKGITLNGEVVSQNAPPPTPTTTPLPTSTPQPTSTPFPTATPTPLPQAGTILYQADTAGGFNDWSSAAGWSTVGDMLDNDGSGKVVTSTAPDAATASYEASGSFYAVEIEMKWAQGDGAFGVSIVGAVDQRYLVGFAPYCSFLPDAIALWASSWDCSRSGGHLITRSELALDSEWHTYRIEVRGDAITVLIDGKKSIETTNNLYYLASGQIGLWSVGAEVSVRRFSVIALGEDAIGAAAATP